MEAFAGGRVTSKRTTFPNVCKGLEINFMVKIKAKIKVKIKIKNKAKSSIYVISIYIYINLRIFFP